MTRWTILRAILVAVLAFAGTTAVAAPARAACGDTTAEWVDPLIGSVWSGTVGTNAMTVVLSPVANVAATVVITQSGAGTWTHDFNTRWTATAAGIWSYRYEVSATACASGKVTSAVGGATDDLSVVHSVSMTRTL